VSTQASYATEDDVKTLLDALELIDERGWFDADAWDWFDIDAEIMDWDNYKEFLHSDIPQVIRDICRAVDAYASIYHLRDDVGMSEYIVLIEKDGKRYTLMLDLDMDCDDGECTATVWIVDGEKGWIDIPVYYHPVPW